jgi:hypothetical protein
MSRARTLSFQTPDRSAETSLWPPGLRSGASETEGPVPLRGPEAEDLLLPFEALLTRRSDHRAHRARKPLSSTSSVVVLDRGPAERN